MKVPASVGMLMLCGLAGCGRSIGAGDLAGEWRTADASEARLIALGEDGKFQVRRFPAAMTCSDSSVAGDIEGEGAWEYEAEGGRVLLNFSKISDSRCVTPYGTVAFVESSERMTAILDVERPSTRIDYDKSRTR